jgi:hypothetical protein
MIMANAIDRSGNVSSSTSRKYNNACEYTASEQVEEWTTIVREMEETQESRTIDWRDGFPVRISTYEAREQLELWNMKLESF